MSNENIIKYKEGDILKYEFMDNPIRFFEVKNIIIGQNIMMHFIF